MKAICRVAVVMALFPPLWASTSGILLGGRRVCNAGRATSSGQFMSQIGQPSTPQPSHPRLRPFEQAPRPLVGYAHDYPDGHHTGRHQHPRAQLLYATTGLMRIETDDAHYAV